MEGDEEEKKKSSLHTSKSPIQKTVAIPTNITQVKQQVRNGAQQARQAAQERPESEKSETQEVDSKPKEAFDYQKVKLVLDEIISDFKEQDKNMERALLKQPFELEGGRVNFLLNGELQEHLFIKMKPELTGLIRKKIRNYNLEIDFEIREEAVSEGAKLYTSSDKLAYLSKKSPALQALQKRFGLETDF